MSGKRTDLNRQRKIYPYIRRKPIYGFLDKEENISTGGISAEIETAEINWSNSDSYTHTFTTSFSSIPRVVAIAKDDNINVYVESVSLTDVTIRASAPSSDSAYIHAINVP
jgi:hypothetical protein